MTVDPAPPQVADKCKQGFGVVMVVFTKVLKEDGVVECHLLKADSWNDSESLAQYVEREFNARVVEQLDGVFTRKWMFSVGDEMVSLRHHEDVGNWFEGPDNCELLRRIVADLNARLR